MGAGFEYDCNVERVARSGDLKNQAISFQAQRDGHRYHALVTVMSYAHDRGWADDRPIGPYLEGLKYPKGETCKYMRKAVAMIDYYFNQSALKGEIIPWGLVRKQGILSPIQDNPHRVSGSVEYEREYG
jgi:hypothetical protein